MKMARLHLRMLSLQSNIELNIFNGWFWKLAANMLTLRA